MRTRESARIESFVAFRGMNSLTSSTSILSTASILRTAMVTTAGLALCALVAFPARDALHLAIASTSADSGHLRVPAGVIASRGLLILVSVAALIGGWSWIRGRSTF